MRLSPIERPPTLTARIAYFTCKRQLGKVITPLKVVYARVPAGLKLGYAINKFMRSGFTLDSGLRLLLQAHVAEINDCAFCVDIGKAVAANLGVKMEKFSALGDYRTNPIFTERERAALAYVEEATRSKRVADDTFARLREHFSDSEIAEITLLNAVENFYNLVNLPLEIESDGLCAIGADRAPMARAK